VTVQRTLFDRDHDDFRGLIRDYLAREVVPVFPDWLEDGQVPRGFITDMGKLGVLGMNIPEQYGGSGPASYVYTVVLAEETARALVHSGPLRAHTDVVLPYFRQFCSEEQRERWFPGIARGDLFSAIAMTEPGTGSDLAGVRTRAVSDGGDFVLNGAKTFITGGILADLIVVVARTSDEQDRRGGLSLLVVEDGMAGFEKGRKLDKLGLRVQDTAELSFTDVRVPRANLLGELGAAFEYLRHNLAAERLSAAVGSLTAARAAFDVTVEYVNGREVFGKRLGSFQNTKFELAAVATELEAGQVLLDRAVQAYDEGELTGPDAAKVKLFCSEVQGRTVDRCLQLFGGYGYMLEYPIARFFADARVSRIYAGTSEVLKMIIAKDLGL
jgi:acyl-CoA dehydrogenase